MGNKQTAHCLYLHVERLCSVTMPQPLIDLNCSVQMTSFSTSCEHNDFIDKAAEIARGVARMVTRDFHHQAIVYLWLDTV